MIYASLNWQSKVQFVIPADTNLNPLGLIFYAHKHFKPFVLACRSMNGLIL